jgi:acetyl esterase/lipase
MTQTLTVPHYDPSARYEVSFSDVEYRNDGERGWLVRVYQPQGSGPFPLLIDVHGGAWRNGDRLMNRLMDDKIASSGIVVAAIDFHSASEVPYPASMADIHYATRWLKLHAADFNATADAMGGLGTSSGGHQVMLQQMRPTDPRYASIPLPEAPDIDATFTYVIITWPVIDPLSRYVYARDNGLEGFAEAGLLYFVDEAGMTEANPHLILERGEPVASLPPTLVIQGAADLQITPGMAEAFVRAYANAGGVIELAKYPGEDHGFARQDTLNTARAIEAMKWFIARQLNEIAHPPEVSATSAPFNSRRNRV